MEDYLLYLCISNDWSVAQCVCEVEANPRSRLVRK